MEILKRNNTQALTPENTNILLFGGGNFVRAFIGSIIEKYNKVTSANLGITVVKVTPGIYDDWIAQDGLYYVNTKGIKNGALVEETELIDCVKDILSCYEQWDEFLATASNPEIKYIISNTTESGLRYKEESYEANTIPQEFPAKLTRWTYERFKIFGKDVGHGVVFMPCELLEDNGILLKNIMIKYADHWSLGDDFKEWLSKDCTFCNTLVDRIVPGANQSSKDKTFEHIGRIDKLLTEGEPYHFLAIEAPEKVQQSLPIDKIGLNIIYTDDLAPYRLRKVRILNGAHSSMVPVGLLMGCKTVGDAMESKSMSSFIETVVYDEVIPALSLPEDELKEYAADILDRFRNPFINHQLISISLNSFSKFKSRILPSIKDYVGKFGNCPDGLCLAYAAMLYLYKGEINGEKIELKDDAYVLSTMQELWSSQLEGKISLTELGTLVAGDQEIWGEDLTKLQGFLNKANSFLIQIEENKLQEVLSHITHDENI